MRRAFMVVLALTMVVLMSFIETSAATVYRMKVDIGFPFYVADNQLPAGEYWIEMKSLGNGTLVDSAPAIRSDDGSVFQFLPARSQGSYDNDPNCYLLFNRVGAYYFLAKVHQSDIDVWLPKSHTQKEKLMAFRRDFGDENLTVVKIAAKID